MVRNMMPATPSCINHIQVFIHPYMVH